MILGKNVKFLYGFSDLDQVRQWLANNQQIIGIMAVGRSNVGKSSLINALFNNSSVCRVSKTPGRTREINVFEFEIDRPNADGTTSPQSCYLFDLPGYGHAEVSKDMKQHWDQLMGLFFSQCPPSIGLILIQDARRPDTTTDQQFNQFLRHIPRPTFLVLNKIDKLKTQKERALLATQTRQMLEKYKWVQQIHQVSSVGKQGIEQLQMSLETHLLKSSYSTAAFSHQPL